MLLMLDFGLNDFFWTMLIGVVNILLTFVISLVILILLKSTIEIYLESDLVQACR